MERRTFIAMVPGSLLVAPLVAEAQQTGKVWRIGFLGGASPGGYAVQLEALRLGLSDHGYVEGKNISIEYRWADGKYERLPALAAELVRLKVDLIITQGTPAALTAKKATATIPIVMAIVGNPVETGVVASLTRPGGNITGSSFFWAELNAKRLELMKTLLPGLARAGVLMNPDNPAMVSVLRVMEERARAINIKLHPVNVRALGELDDAFKLAKAQTEALTVVEDGLFLANPRRIAELAMRNRIPSIGFREYCEAGGLVAYGVDFPHLWRESMVLVDKIFKGAKPADLPIQQATRFELIINLKTAKGMSLTIPPSLLQRADQVIE
jgi:putative tryptophan/tyrosine transport system substrate-binding protein